MKSMTTAERRKVVVAICTYNRHEPLAALLEALIGNAARISERVSLGVVVVDDSSDGNARELAESFSARFELGVTYRRSGKQNIALARNLALETSIALADWVAMTDDDCEPASDWLEIMLDVQERTQADAVTGILKRRVPPDAPKWLTEEPFLELGQFENVEDEQDVNCAATHNSLISGRWLREHPTVRFDPDLGVTGGEDPVFYRAAHAAGLRIRYSRQSIVYENEPASRATLRYQLRTFFWYGNSSYITSVRSGVAPLRMLVHGSAVIMRALARPSLLLARRKPPQIRYGLAQGLRGIGILSGPMGIRVRHK